MLAFLKAKWLCSTELDNTYKEGEAKDNTLLLTQGVERRRWSQAPTRRMNNRFPHGPDIRAIFQVIFCWACIRADSAFGSSKLVKHFNSSSASCKKIPQSSPSYSSISTWSLIKLGLAFCPGHFPARLISRGRQHVLQVSAWKVCVEMS